MPTLAAPLDLAKLEARNLRAHILGSAPSSPVTGQLYYNSGDNTLYWWDGTQWVSARGGAAAVGDATTSSKGVVQLAGDLTGTAVSPQIAAGVITDAEVNAANKDGVVGTASLRTLGSGAQQAMPGNRTLDAITAPAADLSLNSKKIVNLLDPTAAQDGATKAYVDATAQGLSAKASVWAASTGNVDIAAGGAGSGYSIDGVVFNAVSSGTRNRVLLKNQTNPVENGIYIVSGTAGGPQTMARAADMDSMTEFPGAYCWVESGTVNGETGWVCTTDPVAGTTIVSNAWTQFSGAGQITAGAGLTKTGNQLDVGQGTGIVVAADSVGIDTATVPRYYSSATHGAGTSISIPQSTHGCRASRGLIVGTIVEATGAEVLADVTVAANGDVTVAFGASQSANTIRVTIVG